MALTYKIWEFPNLSVQKQLFHAPGMAIEGGFTSGGVRLTSPEPGGRAVLEMQVALQVSEWETPFSSWLMSKINSDIFRIKLTKTPQLVKSSAFGLIDNNGIPWASEGSYTQQAWDNNQFWSNDVALLTTSSALEGTVSIQVDMQSFGEIIKIGHVLGHFDNSYIVDDVEYNGNIATISISPPLRKNVASGDLILTEPYFTGTISNGNEMRSMYEASNVGHIQLNRIIFQEVVT